MKKLLFFVLISLLTATSFSQIEITEKPKKTKVGEVRILNKYSISYTINHEPEMHMFFFRNLKYQYLTESSNFYLESADEVSKIYTIIKETLLSGEDKEFDIELRKNNTLQIEIKNQKVRFFVWDGIAWSYSDKYSISQIKQLFGINDN
jgi:hypothetical protein